MGTTSELLLVAAFGDNNRVFAQSDLNKVKETFLKSFDYLDSQIREFGYTASPIIENRFTTEFFDLNGCGYIDSITWVLSLCVLARFNERKGYFSFTAEQREKIFAYIYRTFDLLISSQHEDGTWGFLSSKESKRSLYFTYAAATSLADIFDYVLGEIAVVETSDESEQAEEKESDKTLCIYLDEKYGGEGNFKKTINRARERVANWLLKTALPYLPALADCQVISDEDREILGVWKHSANDFENNSYEVKYHNLYYTYYLIDMIATMSADKEYQKIKENVNEFSELKNHYKTALFNSYGGNGKNYNYEYYFGSIDRSESFINDYIIQAICASRYHFNNAMRTGEDFWNIPDSELGVFWEYDDEDATRKVEAMIKRSRTIITDPSLSPMALRANTQYVYYISNRSDATLEKLFKVIDSERRGDTPENKEKCIEGLWDRQGYNLAVTERSIEALVDYYDYLKKFEEKSVERTTCVEQVQKSALDLAIEKKIDEYLQERLPELQLPVQTIEQKTSDQENYNTQVKHMISFLKVLNDEALDYDIPDESKEGDTEKLICQLIKLFNILQQDSFFKYVRESEEYCEKDSKDAEELIVPNGKEFFNILRGRLYAQLIKDTDPTFKKDIFRLYSQLRK